MNPRFTLVLVLIVLFGGAGALWYLSSGDVAAPPSTPIVVEPADPAPPPSRPAAPAHFVFAISWEPAFCETAPGKPECRSQTASRFDADNFSLHGLWPGDDYCAVSDANETADRDGRWEDLPAPNLTATTRRALDEVMPGTQSLLERHEWIKHGTCARANANVYFARSIALLAEINGSPIRELFAGNLGRSITLGDVRVAFADAFGDGAGSRVRLACERDGNRRIITELTIGLYGDVMGTAPLADLIAAARPTSGGCESGIVDRVGIQ